jgi:minichromosome maintenance protein 10
MSTKEKGKGQLQPGFTKPAPSSLVSKLASLSKQKDEPNAEAVARSSSFRDAPQVPAAPSAYAQQRDESLALIEELPVGPIDHSPPVDDPNFDQIEPNSGIRLSCASPTSPYAYSH